MATQALSGGYRMWQPVGERRWRGVTPEIYFNKAIDNSRLVKVADPRREREIRMFSLALSVLFLFAMVYAWQHFAAIECGYTIEAQKIERDALEENNRALRLEEASLRDPDRIEQLAEKMGLQPPKAGQVIHLETTADAHVPVMAQASEIRVVESMQ